MTGDRCGSTAGYQAHYDAGTERCRPCKDAQAAWQRDYEKRRYLVRGHMLIDATGTRRRLQALVVMGWRQGDLAEALDAGRSHVGVLMNEAAKVHRDTATKVAELYDERWDKPGPSKLAATKAKARGWLPPLAWDDDTIDDPAARPSRMTESRPVFDEVAVQRAMRGSEVHLRPAERAEAARRLTELGLSAAEIAGRLRIPQRSVTRYRTSAREVA